MTIETTRFGNVEYQPERVITIGKGLPGLEALHRFVIVDAEATKPIVWLQSLEDVDIALPVIYAFEIVEDYAFDVQDDDIEALEIRNAEDLIVLNVVVLPEDVTGMTANMLAPILINTRLGQGCQVFIESSEYATKTPIFDRICAYMQKGGDVLAGTDA